MSIRDHSAITEFPKALRNASSLCLDKTRVGSVDQAKQAESHREGPASHRGTNSSCRTPGKCLDMTLASFLFFALLNLRLRASLLRSIGSFDNGFRRSSSDDDDMAPSESKFHSFPRGYRRSSANNVFSSNGLNDCGPGAGSP